MSPAASAAQPVFQTPAPAVDVASAKSTCSLESFGFFASSVNDSRSHVRNSGLHRGSRQKPSMIWRKKEAPSDDGESENQGSNGCKDVNFWINDVSGSHSASLGLNGGGKIEESNVKFRHGNSGLSRGSRKKPMKIWRKKESPSGDGECENEHPVSDEYKDINLRVQLDSEVGDVSGSYSASLGLNGGARIEESNVTTDKLHFDGDGSLGSTNPLFGMDLTNGQCMSGSVRRSFSKEVDFQSSLNEDSSSLGVDETTNICFGEFKVGSAPNGDHRRKAHVTASRKNGRPVKLNQGESCSGSNAHPNLATGKYEEVNTASFKFGSSSSSKAMGEHGCVKDVDNGADGMDKVNYPNFQFPVGKNHVDFVFGFRGNDSELRSHIFSDGGKKSEETGAEFQSISQNFGFVFRESKSEQADKKFDRSSKDSNDSSWDSGSKRHTADYSSYSEDILLSSAAAQFRGLNIEDSVVDSNRAENFQGNSSVETSEVFVFGGNEQNTSVVEENHPKTMTEKTPVVSQVPHHSNGLSSFFSFVYTDVPLNSEASSSSVNRDENDHNNAAGRRGGTVDSSESGIATQNKKFDLPFNRIFFAVGENLNSANTSKSVRVRWVKKRNGNLRRSQLLPENPVPVKIASEHDDNPPSSGSPMDISPYQETRTCTLPDADISCKVKADVLSERDESLESKVSRDVCNNSSSSASISAQDGLSALRRYKKYRMKAETHDRLQADNVDKENDEEHLLKDVFEACDQWRIRGNQAYHAGQLSKAEECYTAGINLVSHDDIQECFLESLFLCYSNRAAARMTLRRMREAIEDCKIAEKLDPRFVKATLRAGNCYLVLGEADAAILCYDKCLSSGNDVCLDRRVTIEAADGLQKAKKVAECSHQSAKLLEEGTKDAANNALVSIEKALSISCFSERLLEMKGAALSILWRHDEVIRLCERTLDTAKMNFHDSDHDGKYSCVEYWRWNTQIKAYYRLGSFSSALDLIERLKKTSVQKPKQEGRAEGSSAALAAAIHELLLLKRSGNEAFKSGRYTEAIEHYTSAISKSFESPPFMAICFCNRAAACQSINQFADAILDCSLAIALDENYQKAIARRASLHELIRDYKQAASDLQRLCSLLETESNCSKDSSKKDLVKYHDRLSSVEQMAKKETPLDFYRILGIQRSDSESEIKKAYRKAALKHHPDKARQVLMRNDNGDDGKLWESIFERIHNEADRLFKMIGEAYAVLSDPHKRLEYDEDEKLKYWMSGHRKKGTTCSRP